MDRHTFVAGVLSGLAAPITAGAQQAGKVYRIGWINTASPGWQDDAFRERLRELGYSEGQNIVTDWRWVEGRFDQLPRIAAELVNLKVDLIVAGKPRQPGGAEGDHRDSDCHGGGDRSGRGGTGRQPRAADGQRHRANPHQSRVGRKARGASQGEPAEALPASRFFGTMRRTRSRLPC